MTLPAHQLCESVRFLPKFGISSDLLEHASRCAIENETSAAEELIAFRGLKEIEYFQMLARHLGLRFVEAADIRQIFFDRRDAIAALHPNNIVWGDVGDAVPRSITAPSPRHVGMLQEVAAKSDHLERIVITSPSILRAVLTDELQPELVERAVNHLYRADPLSSAMIGASALQGAVFTLALILFAVFVAMQPSVAAIGLHLLISSFFVACVALRLIATVQFRQPKLHPINPTPNGSKPTYSVMVALHDEAAIVPDLVKALNRLKWPRSKLEIKFVCEADDPSTILALEAENLDPWIEVIKVPASQPRTKPKALCYAIGFTTGKYITLYDAEDRPHPEQLLEAYAAFNAANGKLACVQAPLESANPHNNLWTALFHFEYAGLFNGLLPWLARNRAPILLGGTSNHFCRQALFDVGIWDPHNVTEDADLGLRIWRKGYYTDMITRPTLEDAPPNFQTWLPQRTRWFKGWMQTWIVQMRHPLELHSSMSLSAFITTQILLTGTIASALLHPIVMLKAILLSSWIAQNASSDIWITKIAIVDWLTVIIAYIGFAALCWKSTDKSTRRKLGKKLLLTPLYWMAISLAAWRGLIHLWIKPFNWEKTPHTPHEKPIAAPFN